MSIIIPAYNCAHFLPETLESVFSQNFDAYEIIIVDDGSTDDLVDVLQAYADRVRYIKQANAGSASARNTGLDLARGEYIVFLDADDLLLPGKLKEQAAFLDLRPSLGMVHSGWLLINEAGQIIKTMEPWHKAPELDLKTWFLRKPIRMGAMMYRRLWLESVGGLDPTMRQSHDVDLMLRLVLAGCQAAWMYRPTMAYRYYDSSTIRRNARKQQGYVTRVITKFLAQPHLPEEIQEMGAQVRYYNLRWIAWHLYKSGHLATMVSPFEQAFSYSPKPKGATAVEIAERFEDYFVADGRDPKGVVEIFPVIKQAGDFTDIQWRPIQRYLDWRIARLSVRQIMPKSVDVWPIWVRMVEQENEIGVAAETMLAWWVDVWRVYAHDQRPSSLQIYQQFAALSLDSLIKMSQFCLVLRPGEFGLMKVDRLWADLVASSLVSHEDKTAVTSLYLTVGGQQLMGRRWSDVAKTMMQIIPNSMGRHGWQAWQRFISATSAYYPLGLRQKPHLLIGSIPDLPPDSLSQFIEMSKQAGWQISVSSNGKSKLFSLPVSISDWLPAGALRQLAEDQPADNGRHLRHLRSQRKRLAHYRKLPYFEAVWQAVYLHTLAEALANPHLFNLEYPLIVGVQGVDDGLRLGDEVGWVLQQATAVACASQAILDEMMLQGVPPQKLHRVYPGVDSDFFTPLSQPQPAETALNMVVGVDQETIGLDMLLTAVAQLKQTGMVINIQLLGTLANQAPIMYTIYDLGLETAVTWPKVADKLSRRTMYQNADLFVSTQMQDGIPDQMLEAMSCGLPVVAPDVPSLRELIHEEAQGCLVPPLHLDCLTDTVARLHKNPALRRQMGSQARQQIEAKFTLAHLAANIADLLEGVH